MLLLHHPPSKLLSSSNPLRFFASLLSFTFFLFLSPFWPHCPFPFSPLSFHSSRLLLPLPDMVNAGEVRYPDTNGDSKVRLQAFRVDISPLYNLLLTQWRVNTQFPGYSTRTPPAGIQTDVLRLGVKGSATGKEKAVGSWGTACLIAYRSGRWEHQVRDLSHRRRTARAEKLQGPFDNHRDRPTIDSYATDPCTGREPC